MHGSRGDLDPHGGLVDASKPRQKIDDAAVYGQTLEQARTSRRFMEAIDVEESDVGVGCLAAVAEDVFDVRIGDEGVRTIGTNGPDVHTFVD